MLIAFAAVFSAGTASATGAPVRHVEIAASTGVAGPGAANAPPTRQAAGNRVHRDTYPPFVMCDIIAVALYPGRPRVHYE